MLFDSVFKNSKRSGTDDFPSSNVWRQEKNNWLLFISSKNQLERYLPRLKGSSTQRDEALAEIASAFVMEVKLKYPVIKWEEKTVGGRDVDFVIRVDSKEVYCEVKSPGWEGELEQPIRLSGRTKLPKYINAETRSVAPWEAIRYAVKKSYPKFLPNCQNLLIINDDLFLGILDAPSNINIALSEEYGDYNGEKGYFMDCEFENLGGLLFWDCIHPVGSERIEYRYEFRGNPNAKRPFSLYVK